MTGILMPTTIQITTPDASEVIIIRDLLILLAWQDGIGMMITGVQECLAVALTLIIGVHWDIKIAGNSKYGGYFTSSTTGKGKKLNSTVAEGIGAGAWGDLMGADIHGGIYGMYVEGNNVGIYSKGPIYSSQPEIQLQDVGESERAALFTNTSTEVTVMTSGQGTLVNGRGSILFDQNFKK